MVFLVAYVGEDVIYYVYCFIIMIFHFGPVLHMAIHTLSTLFRNTIIILDRAFLCCSQNSLNSLMDSTIF